jgi:hypothetical protein
MMAARHGPVAREYRKTRSSASYIRELPAQFDGWHRIALLEASSQAYTLVPRAASDIKRRLSQMLSSDPVRIAYGLLAQQARL